MCQAATLQVSGTTVPLPSMRYHNLTTIAELSRQHVELSDDHVAHLQHLVGEWELLADLYFADLLLYMPVDAGAMFLVLAHVRPTNSETTYREDPVGQLHLAQSRPWVDKSWKSGEIVGGDLFPPSWPEAVSVQAVPVRQDGEMLAVLSRERWQHPSRRASPLEATYSDAGFELTRMIAEGTFPYSTGGPGLTDTIRAGDGLVRLDAGLRVRYASPNAVSALHRLGFFGTLESATLQELGVADTCVRTSVATSVPASDELEEGDVSVLLLALPLLRKERSSGVVLLVRDVSEIRRRDRLLLSKEAAIREIHHRVKNNLQTIASLLQLQARRTNSLEVRTALSESGRRIRSIALVHELLSRDPNGWLSFNSILHPLLRDVEEGLIGDRHIKFEVEGDAGTLPADIATPLAVVLTELLQNAVEHAFDMPDEILTNGNGESPGDESQGGGEARSDTESAGPEQVAEMIAKIDAQEAETEPGRIRVTFRRAHQQLEVDVSDNGRGFPPGFDIEQDTGLGLRIVRTLITSELNGTIEVDNTADGACVHLSLPIPPVQVGALAGGTPAAGI